MEKYQNQMNNEKSNSSVELNVLEPERTCVCGWRVAREKKEEKKKKKKRV